MPSTKGEDVRADAGVEERDLEGALGDCTMLADELVHPRLGDAALTGVVDVEPVGMTGRLTVEEHREADRAARSRRREDQVEVARLEAVRDRAAGRFQRRGLPTHRPLARERPVVEREPV